MSVVNVAGFELSQREVILCTIIVVLLAVVFQQVRAKKPAAAGRINTEIGLDKPKVVDFKNVSEIEDLDQLVLCRCWKSKKFPLCDGSHSKHNECCGDNVGPVIIKNDTKRPVDAE